MNEQMFLNMVWIQFIQVTIGIVLIGFVARLTMRRRPHLAHFMLLLVLIKCVTPPVIPGTIISWPQLSPEESPRPTHQGLTSDVVLPLVSPTLASPAMNASFAGDQHGTKSTADLRAAELMQSSFLLWMLGIWLTGATLVGGFALNQWLVAQKRWRSTGVIAQESLSRRCKEVAARIGLQRPITLVVSESNFGPLVSGWWRPTVVLPACLLDETTDHQVDLAIAHELVHLRRGDTLTSGLQVIVRALWWFHPGVWWLCKLSDRATEQCCDEEVIATLQCPPASYAHCLVSILERKHTIQHVMALPGTRPGGITAARLARLGRPAGEFLRRAPLYGWLVFAVLAVVLLPARRLPSSPQLSNSTTPDSAVTPAHLTNGESKTPLLSERQAAFQAFDCKQWGEAISAYEKVVAKNDQDGLSWYRLAYALHAANRLDEAVVAHQKAATFPLGRASALYNLACAYSLQGKTAQALQEFERAIKSGFRSEKATILADTDLESIRTAPDFLALVERAADMSTYKKYRELDFMVGSWTVHNQAGDLLGTSVITKDERGYLLTEKWTSASGSTGTGISYFDPKARAWRPNVRGHVWQYFAHARIL